MGFPLCASPPRACDLFGGRTGWLAPLLSSALVFGAPIAGTGQEAIDSSDHHITATVAAGLTSAYRGGDTYLVSALYSRPDAVPVEVAFEYTPAPSFGNAKILWIGVRTPRGLPVSTFYAGTRGGLLDGPSYNGLLVDVHLGLQAFWKGFGVRVEPALLAGADETLFVGGRVTAGASWTFR